MLHSCKEAGEAGGKNGVDERKSMEKYVFFEKAEGMDQWSGIGKRVVVRSLVCSMTGQQDVLEESTGCCSRR